MDIGRKVPHRGEGRKWVKFCLDRLERAKKFQGKNAWGTSIVSGLSLEEVIGALVAAEQDLEGESGEGE